MIPLKDYIANLLVNEADDNLDDSTLGLEPKEDDKKKLTERGDIKFTIWEAPDVKVNWVNDNKSYQKIEYVYVNKEKDITIDFLLGFDKDSKSWKMWVGKLGAISYDDDPYCSLNTDDFSSAVVSALDKVEEMVNNVKDDPDRWVKYYIHR